MHTATMAIPCTEVARQAEEDPGLLDLTGETRQLHTKDTGYRHTKDTDALRIQTTRNIQPQGQGGETAVRAGGVQLRKDA